MLGTRFATALAALLIATTAVAQNQSPASNPADPARQPVLPDTPGGGPFPAIIETDPTIPNHLVYRPADLSRLAKKKLGVLVWGNGGCADDAASARLHLSELASHGYLVIASGVILSGPLAPAGAKERTFMSTTADDMRKALDWALAENRRKGSRYFGRIDPQAVAVSGHSCGGILSLQLAPDPRVNAIILHNSGVYPNRPDRPMLITDKAMLKGLRTPVLYVIGNRRIAHGPSPPTISQGSTMFRSSWRAWTSAMVALSSSRMGAPRRASRLTGWNGSCEETSVPRSPLPARIAAYAWIRRGRCNARASSSDGVQGMEITRRWAMRCAALRLVATLFLAACAWTAHAAIPQVTPLPGQPTLSLGPFDPAALGYVVEEYVVSGTATSYQETAPPE